MRNHLSSSLSSPAAPRWLRRATAALLGLGLTAGALSAASGAAASTSARPATLAPRVVTASTQTWSLAGDFLRQWGAAGGPVNSSTSTWQYFSVPSSSEADTTQYSLLPTNSSPGCGASPTDLLEWEGAGNVDYADKAVSGLCSTINAPAGSVFMGPKDGSTDIGVSWTSPITGTVMVYGSVSALVGGPQGSSRTWSVYEDGASATAADKLASNSVDPNNAIGALQDPNNPGSLQQVHVTQGQKIYFLLNPNGNFDFANTGVNLTITASPYVQQIVALGPADYYRLGDAAGSPNVTDLALMPFNATYGTTGVTLGTAGALVTDTDTAATGDGTGTIATGPTASPLPIGSMARTVELWFNTSNSAEQELFSFGNNSNEQLFEGRLGADGTISLIGGSDDAVWTPPAPVTDGQWHFLAFTYDANATGATAYLDGQSLGTVPFNGDGTALNTPQLTPLLIGNGINNDSFQGSLDEVAVYAMSLTDQEIANQYAAAQPPATSFSVTVSVPNDGPIVAGSPVNLTVRALNDNFSTATGYTGTVSFSSTDSDIRSVLPSAYTFQPEDHGTHTFTGGLTLDQAGSRTVTATDVANNSISGTSAPLTVTPGPVSQLLVMGDGAGLFNPINPITFGPGPGIGGMPMVAGFPGGTLIGPFCFIFCPISAGTQSGVNVTAEDAFGNTTPGYTGTVHFTSTDPHATLPADYTFTGGDAGFHNFVNGFTFVTAGAPTVTATDTSTPSITGTSGPIVVAAGPPTTLSVSVPNTARVGTPADLTVTANDVYGNVANTYAGTVHFTSSDPKAVLPADYTFTAPVAGTFSTNGFDDGTHTFTGGATFQTAGAQTITATDTVAGALTATSAPVTVTSPPVTAPPGVFVPPTPPTPPPALPPGVPASTATLLGTSTVSSTNGASVSGTSGTTRSQVTVPAGALPDGTQVAEYAVDTSRFAQPAGANLVLGFSVSWTAPDGSTPLAKQPVSLTVSDPSIKAGDTVWMVGPAGNLIPVGTATQDGVATVSFSQDPTFLVSAPASGSTSGPTGAGGTGGSTGPGGTGGSTGTPSQPVPGYRLVGADGGVFDFGSAQFHGSLAGRALPGAVVGTASTPDGGGYWAVGSDGSVYPFGDARSFGSLAGKHLGAPVAGIVATPDGKGYWLYGRDGGVFAFGDAAFHGAASTFHPVAPIVGMAATPDGSGYWLAGQDGGVFVFGNANFYGSGVSLHPAAPIVGMAAGPDGRGYLLVGRDGGVMTFGDAGFHGSAVPYHPTSPIIGLATTPDGAGYWLFARDGGVFTFGTAPFKGSTGGLHLVSPITAAVGW